MGFLKNAVCAKSAYVLHGTVFLIDRSHSSTNQGVEVLTIVVYWQIFALCLHGFMFCWLRKSFRSRVGKVCPPSTVIAPNRKGRFSSGHFGLMTVTKETKKGITMFRELTDPDWKN